MNCLGICLRFRLPCHAKRAAKLPSDRQLLGQSVFNRPESPPRRTNRTCTARPPTKQRSILALISGSILSGGESRELLLTLIPSVHICQQPTTKLAKVLKNRRLNKRGPGGTHTELVCKILHTVATACFLRGPVGSKQVSGSLAVSLAAEGADGLGRAVDFEVRLLLLGGWFEVRRQGIFFSEARCSVGVLVSCMSGGGKQGAWRNLSCLV